MVRFGHPNTANYSASSSKLVPDPYIIGTITTDAPPLVIAPVGYTGVALFASGQCNVGQAATIKF
jgi:hypothetical protein